MPKRRAARATGLPPPATCRPAAATRCMRARGRAWRRCPERAPQVRLRHVVSNPTCACFPALHAGRFSSRLPPLWLVFSAWCLLLMGEHICMAVMAVLATTKNNVQSKHCVPVCLRTYEPRPPHVSRTAGEGRQRRLREKAARRRTGGAAGIGGGRPASRQVMTK